MITIGITGGVGAGKTSVLKYLEERDDTFIVYADRLAEDLQKKGGACYEPLINLLGVSVLNENGEIDRKICAARYFNEEGLLDKVEAIVHPAVKTHVILLIDKLKKEGVKKFFFLEAALLIECGYKEILDEMWYIYADENVRRERLKSSRGYTDERINSILASQLDNATFVANADFIIDNSGSLENSYAQIQNRLNNFFSEV